LQNARKSRYFRVDAFPNVSGHLLGLLHGCCTPWQRQKTSARIKEREVCSFDILAGMKRR
jgi:hypothetical protein